MSCCFTFVKFPLVFGISSIVLNLSKNIFSNEWHESMLLDFNDVSWVKAFSDNVLGKALQSIASSVVTNPMANLYLQICSWNFILHVYKTNWGSFKLVLGKTARIYCTKSPISKAFLIIFEPLLCSLSRNTFLVVTLMEEFSSWYLSLSFGSIFCLLRRRYSTSLSPWRL